MMFDKIFDPIELAIQEQKVSIRYKGGRYTLIVSKQVDQAELDGLQKALHLAGWDPVGKSGFFWSKKGE